MVAQLRKVAQEKGVSTEGLTGSDLVTWLISFSVAYVIVHNFGQIATAGSNLIALATQLVKTGVVAGI